MSWESNVTMTRQQSSRFFRGNSPNSLVPSSRVFPLPRTNFTSARMPMATVYPRPDGETSVHARHKFAHSGMQYTIPIGVQGGAWPFLYEIISAPIGATIGQYYNDADYGVIKWTPPASGNFSFSVRVTDQDQNTAVIIWSGVIDDSKFLFIQDGYTGTKVGTITEPLEDLSDWYKGSVTDDTYANMIVVLRGGNYDMVGDAVNNGGNVRLQKDVKTQSIIGFPSETPIVNCSTAKILSSDVNGFSSDLFVAGIRWENSRQDVANAQFFWLVGDENRITFWDNYFFNHRGGEVGNDNTNAVFISDTGSDKNYCLYKSNVHDDFQTLGGNSGFVDIYRISYVLIEGNEAKNSSTTNGLWSKVSTSFVTIRNNKAVESVSGAQAVVGYSKPAGIVPNNHEVCWNQFYLDPASSDVIFQWANSDTAQNESFNSFIYRNSFVNGNTWIRFKGVENYKVDSNVVVATSLLSRFNTTIMDTVDANLVGAPADGFTDNQGNLTGATRATWLGLVGHEISEV